MGTTRTVELPQGPNGKECTTEMTNLEWSLQFVKLKIQEMVLFFFAARENDTNTRAIDIQWTKDRSMRCYCFRIRRSIP